jgi:hypothetical protein
VSEASLGAVAFIVVFEKLVLIEGFVAPITGRRKIFCTGITTEIFPTVMNHVQNLFSAGCAVWHGFYDTRFATKNLPLVAEVRFPSLYILFTIGTEFCCQYGCSKKK